ncbi:F-box/kelch-repeat protein At3g27150-like [Gastrolobium bilobum]|uniref:F-box/kelch-repeat protein At3g27150-like n=1 Tax=Gastrolobium bilobum TaxID=150636 RepID=UPI002AB00C53|nr:F-box/kelch-repeat protein At3g27150-like [Gastrolobium bilobum]
MSSQNPSAKKIRDVSSSSQEPIVPRLIGELETMILARFPMTEHWKLGCLNKQFQAQLKSGEIYEIRREIGFKEPCVFMLESEQGNWSALDRHFKSCRKLPLIPTIIPSVYSFSCGNNGSFSAGTHLFVQGWEAGEYSVWRYDLATNKWSKAPPMNSPRCLFASASHDIFAFVAGGLETKTYSEVLSSAEKYNAKSQSWKTLPRMIRERKFCSGCYMDNKFYVIGGQDEQKNNLTCGEFFDEETNSWTLVPNMLKDIIPLSTSRSPPPFAVVNNKLYTLDASSNEVKLYMKGTNSWKKLGPVPIKANTQEGPWSGDLGTAFKSLGNELLLIGANSASYSHTLMSVYTCCPDPDVENLQWREIVCRNTDHHSFDICAVMFA